MLHVDHPVVDVGGSTSLLRASPGRSRLPPLTPRAFSEALTRPQAFAISRTKEGKNETKGADRPLCTRACASSLPQKTMCCCLSDGCSCSPRLEREFYIYDDGFAGYTRDDRRRWISASQRTAFAFLCKGSPFAVNVMDTQRVVVFGKGLGSVPINTPTSFTILTQNAGVGELKCSIKGAVRAFAFLLFTFNNAVTVSSSAHLCRRSPPLAVVRLSFSNLAF